MTRNSHLFYQTRARRPMLAEAKGVYMWDVDGTRYLDGSSGAMVSNIGHSDPRVIEAMRRQMDKSTFGYRLHFESEPGEKLAEKVASLSPEGMEKVFFVSGGSEAVESAIKLARQYAVTVGQPSRWKVISRSPSYHGSTLGALALTGYAPLTDPFLPMMQAMPKIPAPRAYLDGLDLNDPATGLHYAAMLEAKILEEGADSVLAFIHEPVGGASTGALVPPAGYMKAVRDICDRHGVILIHDEVMSGGGRTGKFMGAEHWDVAPDIIAISKGFGAGYTPLGAMIAHERFVEPVLDAGGFMHGHTYAGNPLACAAGLAVLDVVETDGLMQNAARIGALLKSRLQDLMQRFPFIGDVRGEGLLLAFELVSDRQTMTPLPKALSAYLELVELAYAQGLIIYSRRTRDGIEGDHFLVCPPMIATEDHVEEIIDKLTIALDQFAAKAGPALAR
ncbi:aspartate aminotransferase family protein [Thalassovita taeanensis]|uniref:Adenosylmethionine-8-amino-7-oxononanoate aminotransferase n=1 Tax=Thalassovita taeanensis TaxID=657014 RepID=A0A1H9IK83_9RHOB|nr:aspartate aminotransferase family protein [Thalassovita taeanensis]SEQ74968.1 Adenosylmethionine-8-amino-7-oxononanoate aminotransferase [Thalassovita taeanensis]